MSTAAIESSTKTSAFGQNVMTHQSKGVNPLVWLVIVVILSAGGYFAYTILSSK